MLSDRDVRQAERSTDSQVAACEHADRLDELTVRDVMTTPVHTVSRDASIADAGQRLLSIKSDACPWCRR